jgi:hypothetical protein
MSDEPLSHVQQFQQAIDTTITCRSIIKYNSTLNDQQKAEILTGIDSMLVFLKTHLSANEVNATSFAQELPAHILEKLADVQIGLTDLGDVPESADLSLKNVYRLYQNYLNSDRVTELEMRYRVVMSVLEQLEEMASHQHDTTSGDLTTEGMLHRIRGFITALYCTFREFAIVFANLIDGKTIDTDTEALALLDQYHIEEQRAQILRDITPLMRIYKAHLQLQERRGMLTRCGGDAIAFLIFLSESLEPTLARRNEMIVQLQAIEGLLNDLTRLLAEYEQAMSALIEA